MRGSPGSFLLGLSVGAAGATLAATLWVASSSDEHRRLDVGLGPNGPPIRAGESSHATLVSAEPLAPRAPSEATAAAALQAEVARVARTIEEHQPSARETPAGTGTLSGTVVDHEDRPLAGVLIRARRESARRPRIVSPLDVGPAAPPADELLQTLQRAAEDHQARYADVQETRTNDAGEYELAGLSDGTYELRAYLSDWVVTPVSRSSGLAPGSQLDFRAALVMAIEVSVVMPDGSEPQTAILRCEGEGDGLTDYAWSPTERHLRLVSGAYEIAALHGQRAASGEVAFDWKSAPQRIELEPSAAPMSLRFALEERSGIRGKVIAAGKDLLPGAIPGSCAWGWARARWWM